MHIPFCLSRCAYCAFASQLYDEALARACVDTIRREIEGLPDDFRPVTAYVGGGTPTVLPPDLLQSLLRAVAQRLSAEASEFTVEANPGTLTPELPARLREAGVNRLSMGAQTFSPTGLAVLGRIHTTEDIHTSVDYARAAGMERLSLDLIHGWPGQTLADWEEDLAAAIGLGVGHLSCYGLTLEEGTRLARQVDGGEAILGSEESAREIFDLTEVRLRSAGILRYEISNHARPGKECRHNLTYWTGGEYFGVGPAAHSHWQGRRFANDEAVQTYLRRRAEEGTAVSFSERLSPEARAREGVVMGLRLTAGIDCESFRARTGFALDELLKDELGPLLGAGWLQWSEDGSHLRLSANAVPVADSVLAELVG